jgi:HEAT repeat protein
MLWLLDHQLKSRNPAARRSAVEQLCQAPPRRALSSLRRALADADAEVRTLAATALGRLEDPRRLEPLLGALRDHDPQVVKAAILALRKIPDEQVTTSLAPLVRHADAGVRGHAAQALDSLGWCPPHQEDEIWFLVARGHFSKVVDFGAAAVPALEAALVGTSSSFGKGAVEALGEIGDARVVRPLANALKSSDPAVCAAAVTALYGLGDPAVGELLVGALRQKNAHVRAAAVEALGKLRATAALDHIRPLLADPVWEVRKEAAEALGRLKGPRAAEALAPSLNDGDADVRETTAIALGNIGDRRSIRPLVLALKDSTTGVRRMAAAALSRIDPEWSSSAEAQDAIAELKAALQDDDGNVRHFVGQLLVSLGAMDPDLAPAADPQAALDSSPVKRRKLAVTLFAALLCDPDRVLRQAAAEALGYLGDPRAQSALLRAQADADPGVSAAAQRAVQTLAAAPG